MVAHDRSGAHVVVVGGGFAGIACAKGLARSGVTVTLIDRHDYHQFQPLLYQVATAQLAPSDVMRPLRGVFRKDATVHVKDAEVESIDVVKRAVTTTDGQTWSGDHLVLATGAQPNYFGVPGAERHSFPLYSVEQARALRNRILQVFEDADRDPSLVEQGALNFVIVGAGATGVETAGALADLVTDAMPDRYRDLDTAAAKIHLVDHGPVVLTGFSDRAHAYARKVLERKGVELVLDRSVTEVRADRVVLGEDGEILTRCVVWGGGISAPLFLRDAGLPTGKGDRVRVMPDLTVPGLPGVYAVGDCANVAGPDGTDLPQLGSVAMQAGSAAAAAIVAEIDGRPAPAFKYHDKGIMAMIGRGSAVAEMGAHRHELHGPVAFSAWLGVHAWLMGSSRERVDAFISWGWDSFSENRLPAVIDDPDAPRIDWHDDDHSTTAEGLTS